MCILTERQAKYSNQQYNLSNLNATNVWIIPDLKNKKQKTKQNSDME